MLRYSGIGFSMSMRIPREELLEIFPEIKDFVYIFYTEPDDNQDLLENYAPSKLWRLNNLYTIIDKEGHKIPFKMNYGQLLVYRKILDHNRQIILKSRQWGISTFYLVNYFDNALHLPHRSIGMQAQGREESKTLLQRVKILWDSMDPVYVAVALENVTKIKDSDTEQSFSNGSIIYIRSSFRSATLHDLHVSEFGKTASKFPDKAAEIISGSLEACAPRRTNNVAIESTAEGEDKFKDMWDSAVETTDETRTPEDFIPVFLSWIHDPDCVSHVKQEITPEFEDYFHAHKITSPEKQWFYVAKKRRLKSRMLQEYPTTPDEAFATSSELAYYASLYTDLVHEGRVVKNLYDNRIPVYCAVDLGISDIMSLTYFQFFENKFRIVGEFSHHNEDIGYYVREMFSRPYYVDRVFLPHDAEVRSLNDKKTRTRVFKEHGCKVSVLRRSGIIDGIDTVKKYLPTMLIDESCDLTKKMFRNYRKEWDEKLQVPKNQPLHNFWSHIADSVRIMAMAKGTPGAYKPSTEKDKIESQQRENKEKLKGRKKRKKRRIGGI